MPRAWQADWRWAARGAARGPQTRTTRRGQRAAAAEAERGSAGCRAGGKAGGRGQKEEGREEDGGGAGPSGGGVGPAARERGSAASAASTGTTSASTHVSAAASRRALRGVGPGAGAGASSLGPVRARGAPPPSHPPAPPWSSPEFRCVEARNEDDVTVIRGHCDGGIHRQLWGLAGPGEPRGGAPGVAAAASRRWRGAAAAAGKPCRDGSAPGWTDVAHRRPLARALRRKIHAHGAASTPREREQGRTRPAGQGGRRVRRKTFTSRGETVPLLLRSFFFHVSGMQVSAMQSSLRVASPAPGVNGRPRVRLSAAARPATRSMARRRYFFR